MKSKKYLQTAIAYFIVIAIADAIEHPDAFMEGWNMVSFSLGHFFR